jgi:hypothetical protein
MTETERLQQQQVDLRNEASKIAASRYLYFQLSRLAKGKRICMKKPFKQLKLEAMMVD